jgi:hypothetical protein
MRPCPCFRILRIARTLVLEAINYRRFDLG